MTLDQAIRELEAGGWLSVADDLRDGYSPAIVLRRLDEASWDGESDGIATESYDEAKAIVGKIDVAPTITVEFTEAQLAALADRTPYVYNSLTPEERKLVNRSGNAASWYEAINLITQAVRRCVTQREESR